MNQPTLIKPPTSHPAPIPPTQQDIILAKDDIVDVIDAENEDPFTLESFYTLLQLHIQANKDLILARVTTVDPSNESKLYYSYYAAHHINKVLFRTQPEEGLLHRMKAKNVILAFLPSFSVLISVSPALEQYDCGWRRTLLCHPMRER